MAHKPPLLSIGILMATVASSAAQTVDGVTRAERESLDAFAAANASCVSWSDGCIVCRRRDSHGFGCSTPGIACRPSGLACQDASPVGGAH